MKATFLHWLLIASSSLALGRKDGFDVTRVFRSRAESLDDIVHRRADELNSRSIVARIPQAPPPAPTQSVAANLTGADPASIDLAEITERISTGCNDALGSIQAASNDAGFLGCYNVAFFSTGTGVFQADLRLFQLSPPTGPFSGVQPADIRVELSYPNAAFSIIPQGAKLVKREDDLEPRQAGGQLVELQSFWFVGQVNSDLALLNLQDTDLMALVIPAISLAANNPGGSAVTTNLTSSSMAFFTAGVFEGQGTSGAAAAVPSAAAAAATKAATFTLPGTTLGIFPIGLIITSVWALIFLGVVGYGTWGRIQFRDQFRERKGKEVAAGRS